MEERAAQITDVELPEIRRQLAPLEHLVLPDLTLKALREEIRRLEEGRQPVREDLRLAKERRDLQASKRRLEREQARLVRIASEREPSEVSEAVQAARAAGAA
jgi:hypothetical protein